MRPFKSKHRLPALNAPNIIAGATCLVVFVLLVIHLIDQHRFVRSDDAIVQAHFSTLSARVPGLVSHVYVEEHDPVKKGQVLATIDLREYQNSSARRAESVQSSKVRLDLAAKDLKRAEILYGKNIISEEKYDDAKTAYAKIKAELSGDHARYTTASIDEDYTLIRAPYDGIIALRAISPGTEVKRGDSLFGIVLPSEKWVEAKIKETDLRDLHLGETVQVEIDALPGRKFDGKIESISPSTEGLEAAVVPDNAAGNFTKYVQRIAVKVSLSLEPKDQEEVRVGLSANIRIKRKSS